MILQEKKIRNRFIFLSISLSTVIIIVVSLVFYKDLNNIHNMVFNEYKEVYMANSDRELESVVNYFVNGIRFERHNLVIKMKSKLREKVDRAVNILRYFSLHLTAELGNKELGDLLLRALIVYDKDITVISSEGKVLASSYFEINSNMNKLKDELGNNIFYMIRRQTKGGKGGGAFIYAYLRDKAGGVVHRELIYVKYFRPFGWYVCGSTNYNKLEDSLKDKFKGEIEKFKYGLNRKGYIFVLRVETKSNGIRVFRVVSTNKLEGAKGEELPIGIKDDHGDLLKGMVDIALKKGEGFIKYKYKIIGMNRITQKTTYIKYYPPWHWIIGTGYYPSIFYSDLSVRDAKLRSLLKKYVIELILELAIFNTILLFVLLVFVNRIMKDISLYRTKLENKEKFQVHLIESIQNPLFVMDKEGEFLNINKSFEDYFCVKEKELVSGKFDSSSIALIRRKALDALKRKANTTVELQVRVCNSNEAYIEINNSIFTDPKGRAEGVIGVIFDITSKKLSESRLMEISIKDELTGLFNRRYFNQMAPMEIERSKRYVEPLSLILYDIDRFKRVNDVYGHQTGDRVLKELSRLIQRYVRSSDLVFRIGGEEFVILLVGTDKRGALEVAEKLRKEVEEFAFSYVGKITVSFGVASLKKSDTFEEFFKRADMALYKAKNNGRNRVEFID